MAATKSRAELVEILKRGESVIHDGTVYKSVEELPDEAALIGDDIGQLKAAQSAVRTERDEAQDRLDRIEARMEELESRRVKAASPAGQEKAATGPEKPEGGPGPPEPGPKASRPSDRK